MITNINTIIRSGGITFSSDFSIQSGARTNVNEPIVSEASGVNVDVNVPNTDGRLKFFGIRAVGADMTVGLYDDTNTLLDASAEYELERGQSFFWPSYEGEPAPAWVDEGLLAKLKVDNDSPAGTAGTLQASILFDPTA
jgi:hypothetical protein